MVKKRENRFEVLVDIDTDGAVFQVGLQHSMIGPPQPAFHIGTGALELTYCAHFSDIDAMIAGLKEARKVLKKLGFEPKPSGDQ